MKIQSISVVVPTKHCVNSCPFCVSKMHDNYYSNVDFDFEAYKKRIKYAVLNDVTSLIITGTGEALQNKSFLRNLSTVLQELDNPFPNVELQTTGVFLNDLSKKNDDTLFLLKQLGINTISLSISDVFDSKNNMDIIGVSNKLRFDLAELTNTIKENGFNLRFSLNLINTYNDKSVDNLLNKCKELNANQITFRKMYFDPSSFRNENKWVEKNRISQSKIDEIENYIIKKGNFLYRLPYGARVYSILGMSVAIDSDCMAKEENDNMKYVIVRENGKLYCKWDDEGSLIF